MMKPIKLVVFMLDALCTLDLDQIRTLPNMGAILNRGSYVRHLEPIYPSLTYPCHVAVITGNTAKGTASHTTRKSPSKILALPGTTSARISREIRFSTPPAAPEKRAAR